MTRFATTGALALILSSGVAFADNHGDMDMETMDRSEAEMVMIQRYVPEEDVSELSDREFERALTIAQGGEDDADKTRAIEALFLEG